jgi:uncharacterized membrane protein (DUF106 family)
MASRPARPLPSPAPEDEEETAAPEEEGSEEEGSEEEEPASEEDPEESAEEKEEAAPLRSGGAAPPPVRPRPPPISPWKSLERFILIFLGLLGIYMLFDTSARNGVAVAMGDFFAPTFGFGGQHVLLTMFLTGVVEMAITAVAYHFTTDWVEAARVQKHNQAIRPLYTRALRSGKKDRIEALKPHMTELQNRQTHVTFAQLKGMVVTWVLIIAIYTWMGLFISASTTNPYVNLFGARVDLLSSFGPLPIWFAIFSLYTLPLNLIFRRYLKHVALSRRLGDLKSTPPVAATERTA